MAKLNPNNYANLEPLDGEELLEKLAEFQRNADAAEATWDDLKEQARDAKLKFEKWRGKVAMIGRAHEQVHSLYLLKGGELTEDSPDTEGSLDFGDDGLGGQVEEPQDSGDLIEEVVEEPAPRQQKGGGRIYPAEQDGQVYRGKSSQGNTCTVKKQAAGWYGRVSGKPIATEQGTAAAAMKLVDEHVKENVDWNPTITLDDPEDVAPKPDPEPEAEDLTGGL